MHRQESWPMKKQETRRVPLRERNKQRVIQRIQEAAFELFRTVGYDQTTMDAIAEQAETSRGTVFHYFPSKGSLWLHFLKQRYVEQVQPEVNVYLATHPTILQALRFLFTRIHEHVFQIPEMGHALQALQQEVLHAHPREADINKGSGFIDAIQTILLRGQQQGDVRSDLPLEKLARYITMLSLSHVSELLEKNASPASMLDIESWLAFIRSGLS